MELSQIIKAGALPARWRSKASRKSAPRSARTPSPPRARARHRHGRRQRLHDRLLRDGGVISIFALVLNVLIILSIMALSRATLTLSGIGGILLTIAWPSTPTC